MPSPVARLPFRLRAAAGLAGPVLFTGTWALLSAREHGVDGYTVQREQVSGLAAADASHPALMTAGFLTAGASSWLLASALEEALGGKEHAGWAPRLVRGTGAATVAAGIFRRDQKLLIRLDRGEHQSAENNLHDAMSGLAFACMFFTPLALARRLRDEPGWQHLVGPGIAVQLVSTTAMALLKVRGTEEYRGIIQRIGLALPLASSAALAARLLRHAARVA